MRVATKSWSIYSAPSLESNITGTWYRDDLLHVYGEVRAQPSASSSSARRISG